jgi:hypothetical protein
MKTSNYPIESLNDKKKGGDIEWNHQHMQAWSPSFFWPIGTLSVRASRASSEVLISSAKNLDMRTTWAIWPNTGLYQTCYNRIYWLHEKPRKTLNWPCQQKSTDSCNKFHRKPEEGPFQLEWYDYHIISHRL